MLFARLEPHEINHVDHPDADVGQVLPKERGGGEGFEGRHVPRARQDHVGLAAPVVARPLPDPGAGGAVGGRRVHVEVLEGRLLARHDHVDVVPAPEAVPRDREQRVRVRWQIDADDLGLLVDDVVDESRILVREAVVVLTPDVGGQEVVERGDRARQEASATPSATWRVG